MANCKLGLIEEPSRSISVAENAEAVAVHLLIKLPRCKQEKIGKGRDGCKARRGRNDAFLQLGMKQSERTIVWV